MSMDMTAEAMDKVVELAKPVTFEITDPRGVKTTYSNNPLVEIKGAAPDLAATVEVSSLSGFVALILAKLETIEPDVFATNFLIHVVSDSRVELRSSKTDNWGRRLLLIKATPVQFEQFRFGQWMGQEEFAIAVASKFAETPDRAYVLNAASSLLNEASTTSEDNGFVQKVSMKQGLRMKQETTLKPRVSLAPYRTFPEVEQPASDFVFRARCNDGGTPQLMLVEADGGRWKVAAMETIKRALEEKGLNIPIIA